MAMRSSLSAGDSSPFFLEGGILLACCYLAPSVQCRNCASNEWRMSWGKALKTKKVKWQGSRKKPHRRHRNRKKGTKRRVCVLTASFTHTFMVYKWGVSKSKRLLGGGKELMKAKRKLNLFSSPPTIPSLLYSQETTTRW
jgi:hypothetical protein